MNISECSEKKKIQGYKFGGPHPTVVEPFLKKKRRILTRC
jgi:hypothetical protein